MVDPDLTLDPVAAANAARMLQEVTALDEHDARQDRRLQMATNDALYLSAFYATLRATTMSIAMVDEWTTRWWHWQLWGTSGPITPLPPQAPPSQ